MNFVVLRFCYLIFALNITAKIQAQTIWHSYAETTRGWSGLDGFASYGRLLYARIIGDVDC